MPACRLTDFYNPPVIIGTSNNTPFDAKNKKLMQGLPKPYIEGRFIIFNYIQYIFSILDLYKRNKEEIKENRVKWFDDKAEYLKKELNIAGSDSTGGNSL